MSPRSPEALAYFGMEPHYADQFAMLIDADWDATVSPPSSTTSAKAYLKPIAARARATDWSGRFEPIKDVKSSGDPPPALDELIASLSYKRGKDEGSATSLLFVDDVFATGRTLAAVLHHLRQAGLPRICKIGAAAPLWLK